MFFLVLFCSSRLRLVEEEEERRQERKITYNTKTTRRTTSIAQHDILVSK